MSRQSAPTTADLANRPWTAVGTFSMHDLAARNAELVAQYELMAVLLAARDRRLARRRPA
ncbi:MAG: hypothetical protein AAGC55_08145 [Myxococcota bacterium]